MEALDPRLLLLAPEDNIAVAREPLDAGSEIAVGGGRVVLAAAIPRGHKIAVRAIAAGEKIVKYGAPIGVATRPIAAGAHAHLHNIRSDYTPTHGVGGMGVGGTQP
ncbi:MAG: UxaA family hydrolase [Rhodospirillales bacterium]|nr:UxaA family hydrolase [Rhodospirillales bacterium]